MVSPESVLGAAVAPNWKAGVLGLGTGVPPKLNAGAAPAVV